MLEPGNRRALVLLTAALIAASCGGGGSKTAAGTTVPVPKTAAPAIPAATTTTADPALKAKAQAAVLQLSDFTPGFVAFVPTADDPNGGLHIDTLWKNMADCMGVDTSPGPQSSSATFKRGLATQAVSTVEYTSESSAAAVAAAMAGPMWQNCAIMAFNKNADSSKPDGAHPDPAVVTALNVPPVGQKMYPYRINVTMHLGNPPLDIKLFQDYYVVVNGGTITRLWFLNPGSEFPQNLEQTVVKAVVTRAG